MTPSTGASPQPPQSSSRSSTGISSARRPPVAAAAAPEASSMSPCASKGGYSPSEIEVPAGSRVRMTFDRREEQPVLRRVVIPDFGIRQSCRRSRRP